MKKLTKYIVFTLALGLFTITTAKADNVNILLGGWSNHLKHDSYHKVSEDALHKFNSSHNMVGFEYKNIVLSTFKNSYYNTSVLLGYNYSVVNFKTITNHKLNLVMGVVSGYNEYQAQEAYIGKGLSLYLLPTINTEIAKYKDVTLSLDTGIILGGNPVLVNSINIKIDF